MECCKFARLTMEAVNTGPTISSRTMISVQFRTILPYAIPVNFYLELVLK